jgi:competence protein ComEA
MNFRSWILPAILAGALWAPRPGLAQNDSLRDDSPATLLDLNSASVEQLDGLPGIGPARAALIVRIRERNGPFQSVDELRVLPRLSEKLFARLRERVTVAPRQDEVESHTHRRDPHFSQSKTR